MGFRGVVFSDDIGMAAADTAGGVPARVAAHLDAGCDVVLVCAPKLVPEALASLDARAAPDLAVLAPLMGADSRDWHGLAADSRYDSARAALSGPDFRVA
jgi:beta-N-acetylhexosaminidase